MKSAQGILMIAGMLFMSAAMVQAQGRSNHRDRDSNNNHRQQHDRDYDRHDNYSYSNQHSNCNHTHYHVVPARRVVHHVHNRYCDHRTVAIEYHRPRYVYYKDYNVYYDCHRNVYIVYSGRSWTVSSATPVCLNSVDLNRASRMDVEYDNDDFPEFLSRRDYTAYRN
jgi:hypothetical protein